MRIHVKPRYLPQQEIEVETVNSMLESGELGGGELAWIPGLTDWVKLREIQGVRIPPPSLAEPPAEENGTPVVLPRINEIYRLEFMKIRRQLLIRSLWGAVPIVALRCLYLNLGDPLGGIASVIGGAGGVVTGLYFFSRLLAYPFAFAANKMGVDRLIAWRRSVYICWIYLYIGSTYATLHNLGIV